VFIVLCAGAENVVPNLLGVLCSNEMAPRQHLETQQALFKQFAEILDFTLKFDDLKVNGSGWGWVVWMGEALNRVTKSS